MRRLFHLRDDWFNTLAEFIRESEDKKCAQIIDFVDSYSGMLLKMYRNRILTYRKMGYRIHEDERLIGPLAMFGRNLYGSNPLSKQ